MKPLGLLVQKTAGAGGTGGVSSETLIIAVFVKTNQAEFFSTYRENGADEVMETAYSSDQGHLIIVLPGYFKNGWGGMGRRNAGNVP